MSDLLNLDYSKIDTFSLCGIDIDECSLNQAQQQAKKLNLENSTTFIKNDAWNLILPEPVDILTSNGLNIYEHNDERVTNLYRQFHKNIKPKGIFITSFLTPIPLPDSIESSKIDANHACLQRILFSDILEIGFQARRSTQKTIKQLKTAGFKNIKIIPDKAGIFPTITANA